ncbi:VapE domain-containing protein [Cupriavidus oxalaticus]|uniref:VapE domain-containing protein n=1 Tax=Cupriavidus oxalaticus TaxID=96344 RepID=UPI00142EAC11|nr:VapE domain-containing protein [Cupriavidus oxalaticus]
MKTRQIPAHVTNFVNAVGLSVHPSEVIDDGRPRRAGKFFYVLWGLPHPMGFAMRLGQGKPNSWCSRPLQSLGSWERRQYDMREKEAKAALNNALLDSLCSASDDSIESSGGDLKAHAQGNPLAHAPPTVNASLQAALDFAVRGWAVFPLKPEEKIPLTQHGFKDATTDPATIRQWWTQWPDANIGIATGCTSGLLVLDIDVKDGAAGAETLQQLESEHGGLQTRRVQTPSGGQHLYFNSGGDIGSRGKLLPGLDVRAEGGYVVAPPSVLGNGAYQWINPDDVPAPLPESLLPLLRGKREDAHAQDPPFSVDDLRVSDDIKALIREGAPRGQRSERLFGAIRAMVAAGHSDEEIASVLLDLANGLGEKPREQGRAWLSGEIKRARSKRDQTETLALPGAADSFKPDGTKRTIAPTVTNVTRALAMGSYFVRYDIFLDRLILERKADGERQPLKDSDYNRMQEALEHMGFLTPDESRLRSCVARVAEENSFDSLTEYMDALPPWDGVLRIDTFFTRYCCTEDTPYHTAAGRYLFTALAGRALNPGCKADGVIVLIGEQYVGKTSLIHALAPVVGGISTAGKIALDAKDDDTYRKMQGKTICEIAEMRGFGTREQEAIKDFISSTEDEWVPKYKELAHRAPRRTIFMATTNEREFLKDPTGNRRWFPVEVGTIEVDAVRQDLPQLLAEGKVLYQDAGVLYEEAMRQSAAVHDNHIKHSELHESIQEALAWKKEDGTRFGDTPFKLEDLLFHMQTGKTLAETPGHFRKEVVAELRLMGYDNPNLRYGGQQERRWLRKQPSREP